jgi:hypothetical protein
MDAIFRKTTSIWDVVKVAADEPLRYGKNGELLINYTETDEHFRRASHVSEKRGNKQHADPAYQAELGHAEEISDTS